MSVQMIVQGDPVNDAERRAFELLRLKLDAQPEEYFLCTNISLMNGSNRMSEIDAIVVGPSMIFTVEVKGWNGRVTQQRERWFLDDGTPRPNPAELLARKAKNLKSELERFDRNRLAKRPLWVQELIFVNGLNAKLVDIDYDRRTNFNIVPFAFDNAAAFISAITKPDRWANVPPFTPAERESIKEYLVGGKMRPKLDRLNNYVIIEPLPSTTDRVERLLARNDLEFSANAEVELHVYTLDGTKKQREETREIVRRQISTITGLAASGMVPRVSPAFEAEWNGSSVFAIPFESLAAATPLGEILADSASRGLKDSLRYGIALAKALGALHAQGIVHGALEPSAIVLRDRTDPGSIVIRNLELARPITLGGVSLLPASTVNALANKYASPKVLQGGRPGIADDIFSFGALFFHLVFGKPMFENAAASLAGGVIPAINGGALDAVTQLRLLISELLARNETARPAWMADVISRLDRIRRGFSGEGSHERLGEYEILRELRAGATGRTVVAQRRQLAGEFVLKIAKLGTPAADALLTEVELLFTLRHEHIVVARTAKDVDTFKVGEFDLVPGADLAQLRGRLNIDQVRGAIIGIFGALEALHARGRVHRDVKPANIMLRPDNEAVLLDFGLLSKVGDPHVEVGTAPYKSSRLLTRGTWSCSDDVYAGAVTLWEAIGGTHPWGGKEPVGEPRLDAADLITILGRKDAEGFAQSIRALLATDDVSALEAKRRLLIAIGKNAQQTLPLEPEFEIVVEPDVTAADPLERVALSEQLSNALRERGVVTLDDARRLRTDDFLRMRTVGRAAVDELGALLVALRDRFGPLPAEEPAVTILPAPLLGFAPTLTGDERPIAQLLLGERIDAELAKLGKRTIGELAALRATTVLDIPELGADAERRIREALAKFSDDPEGVLVDHVLPPWRLESLDKFNEVIGKLGVTSDQSLAVLHAAGGDVTGRIAWAPPWTADDLARFVNTATERISWPPSTKIAQLDAVANQLPERILGLGKDTLADAVGVVFRADPRIENTADDTWFRPAAVTTSQAIAYARERVALPMHAASLLRRAQEMLPGTHLAGAGSPEAHSAFASAGLDFNAQGQLDRKDARVEPDEPGTSQLDDIERSPLDRTVEAILTTRRAVSFRLIVTEPGSHVMLAKRLLRALRDEHGAERVHAVDFDRALCDEMEAKGFLDGALKRDAREFVPEQLQTFAGAAARTVLRGALVAGRRDDITLLYNMGSLTHTKEAGALRKLYEDARGGTDFGAIVVCVPGDHPREYARLNRKVPLVVTGSDPLLYLEATA